MARDHYVPRTHLRHFTKEYLAGGRGVKLEVFSLYNFRSRKASIGVHLGCEDDFFANHAIDKRWQLEETKWPATVAALQGHTLNAGTIADLLKFAAIQVARVPINMERIARPLALQKARRVELPDRPGHFGMVAGMVSTADLLDFVEKTIPARYDLFCSFTSWTCYHSQTAELFITSDNPCVLDDGTSTIYYPIAANLAVVGRRVEQRLPAPSLTHRSATPALVRKVNAQIVKGAKDYIYASEATAGLATFIRKQRKGIDNFARAGRTFAPTVDAITESEFHDLRKRVNALRVKEGRPPC